jgi:hypothetical protein
MTATAELVGRLRGLLEKATALPWSYRPDPYDDWGFIRGPAIELSYGPGQPVVAISRDNEFGADHDEHRRNKTDPFEPNGRLITEAVNALPTLLTTIETLAEALAEATKADEETYQIGKRDGHEFAVQCIDIETGGDGVYRYCLGGGHWPETHCPDAGSMKMRIQRRFSEAEARAGAADAERDRYKTALEEALAHVRNGAFTIYLEQFLDQALSRDGGGDGAS